MSSKKYINQMWLLLMVLSSVFLSSCASVEREFSNSADKLEDDIIDSVSGEHNARFLYQQCKRALGESRTQAEVRGTAPGIFATQ